MTAYLDSSALLKLYVGEPDTDVASTIIHRHRVWTTGRHTLVEVRRNLARLLEGDELQKGRRAFAEDWANISIVELDELACGRAAEFAEQTGVKALDALHLGAAERAGAGRLPIVTFDRRLADAARSLGWTVLGA